MSTFIFSVQLKKCRALHEHVFRNVIAVVLIAISTEIKTIIRLNTKT